MLKHELLLASDGIFPTKIDETTGLYATGFSFPGTIQGEGKLAGVPSLFIRLAGCNLRCVWKKASGDYCFCDTPHGSFDLTNSKKRDVDKMVNEIYNNYLPSYLVITGGEPFLQASHLYTLIIKFKKRCVTPHITIETNGTIFVKKIVENADLISISPKLSNSLYYGEANKTDNSAFIPHYDKVVANNFIKYSKDYQIKFVVSKLDDEYIIKKEYLSLLKTYNNENIIIMPLGATDEELKQTTPIALEIAIRNNWRFSPRLHISLFGNKDGV